jgi:hypothetical protein
MLFNPKHQDHLERLIERLRLAPAVTSDLVSDVMDVCTRLALLRKAGKAGPLDRLIGVGAWTDAALVVMALELPAWTLRRLVCEDGEWLCALSTQPNLPIELDATADARHEILPLAILSACLEARRRSNVAHESHSGAGPRVQSISDHAVCCDNFA